MFPVKPSGSIKSGLPFCLVLALLSFPGCSDEPSVPPPDAALEIFSRATIHVEQGRYEQAALIYSTFIESHTGHPYLDDAAYRLAYLRVIADKKNPYFNYQKAVLFFENFIETYPNSRYINACTNWLHVLNKIIPAQAEPVNVSVTDNEQPAANKQLQKQLSLLEEENKRLLNKIRELQDAIER